MKWGMWVVLIVLIVLAVLFISDFTGRVANLPICRTVQEAYAVQVPYEEQDCVTVPYTDQECDSKKLTYKSTRDEMERDVTCIDSHEECAETGTGWLGDKYCKRYETICDEYREMASFEITNLDTEAGTWQFDWMRNCRANQPLCAIDGPTLYRHGSMFVEPTETQSDTVYQTYDGRGQEFLFVTITYVPDKQVCRDVIKNREVCKTVTRYRTETRYRDKQICD